MPRVFTSKTQQKGSLGESIACKYLISKGYVIIERNYTTYCGEIDIIAQFRGTTHFIEVKSVTREKERFNKRTENDYNPAENLSKNKLERIYRTIGVYFGFDNVRDLWQVDLLCVYIDHDSKKAKVELFESV
jgi:putative endonuclease